MLSAMATVTLHLSNPRNPSTTASEINILCCLLSVLDFTYSKDPQLPPSPPVLKKKLCRINSDTPQFLMKTSWAIKYCYFSIAVRTANLSCGGSATNSRVNTFFQIFFSTNGLSTASCCIIDHFTVMSLLPQPLIEGEAEFDLVLIQTSILFL